MIKKLLLPIIISLCLAPQATVAAQEIGCLENVIIATDLDDVILKGETTQRILGALNPLNSFMTGAYALACATHYKSGVTFSRACGEALYIAELRKNNNVETRAAQFVRMMAQYKTLIPETVKLYNTLHTMGIQFVTATNIGSIFFNDLTVKFPDVFNDRFIKSGLTVDYGVQDVIEKPDVRYFQALQTKINSSGNKTIIFIDDKLENVQGAQKAGLTAIHFQNAAQLKEELEQILGVDLQQLNV